MGYGQRDGRVGWRAGWSCSACVTWEEPASHAATKPPPNCTASQRPSCLSLGTTLAQPCALTMAMRPSVVLIRLPGCGSACSRPVSHSWRGGARRMRDGHSQGIRMVYQEWGKGGQKMQPENLSASTLCCAFRAPPQFFQCPAPHLVQVGRQQRVAQLAHIRSR